MGSSPSSLTTSGIFRSSDLAAFTIPLATVAQLTIPPNMFTRIALTYIARGHIDWVNDTGGIG